MARYLRDAVSEGCLRLCSNGSSANEHLDTNGLVVNLHTLERIRRLDGLIGFVEDDRSTSQALAVRSILKQNPTGLANVDDCVEVFLQGALVVVANGSCEHAKQVERVRIGVSS